MAIIVKNYIIYQEETTMKKARKIITLFAAALLCVLPILSTPITAKAVEPTTYSVKYDSGSGDWRYMVGQWNDESTSREIYYLKQDIVDGDYLVIAGADGHTLELNVRLGNLTILSTASIPIITVKGIDNLYVLNNSQCVINGDVTNAYIYDRGLCNFNNNVSYLEIIGTSDINAIVAVGGTAGHVKGYDNNTVYYDFYNFNKGTLYIENGSVRTDEKEYSKTAPAGTATTTTPATTTSSAGTTSSSNSAEYDDVPKTGESNIVVWLMAAALLCTVGSYELKRNK